MKFTAKQVGRQVLKAEKQVSVEEKKSKDALQKGNIDSARIYAENAIRNKNQAVSYMKLQSQLEAVTSKLQSQQLRAQVTNELAGVTQNLDMALGSMDMAKISEVMGKFIFCLCLSPFICYFAPGTIQLVSLSVRITSSKSFFSCSSSYHVSVRFVDFLDI